MTSSAPAQGGGDQIVDGIGETSLIARYMLDGNSDDHSRNSFKATLHGATFVDDKQFGRVLSFSGEKGVSMELPSAAIAEAETISVSAWVNLNSDTPNQQLFDFSKDASSQIAATLTGDSAKTGYRALVTSSGAAGAKGPEAASIAKDHWVHIAVVLDPANKTLSTFANGVRVGQSKDISLSIDKILDQKNPDANKLIVGVGLNGKLHDLRLYSVPLSDDQVATIYKNAANGAQAAAPKPGTVAGGGTTAAVAGAFNLVTLPDVTATTAIGQLPKLPAFLAGGYADGIAGPQVRVIWPSPTNNAQVLAAGTYTVTGRVPGTDLTPKATITISATAGAPAPHRSLEAFALGDVVFNQDLNGNDTQFMQNRDKFVRTLATTNTDNFLYMFRDAFGQPQPQGARALGGWDMQATKLRGHASGHYMSALAQAYASSSYDPKLQAVFLQKMNYMIDTLYDLSQKSGMAKDPGGPANADPTKVPPGPGRNGYDSNLAAGQIHTDYWNWGKGFISAYPPDQFIMLENGATYGGTNNQIWAPYYTLHKILAGLLDCYEVGGNKKALDIATGMGIWVEERLKNVPLNTRIQMWNRYIAGEYGGMNEVMARMYRLTKDKRFLDGAALFDNVNFFYGDVAHSAGLADNVDTLRGRHANQHIPQITGALENFRDGGDAAYFRIADNFWDIATTSYMYSIGGVAGGRNPNNAECFTAQPDSLFQNGFAQGGQNETCATYNMLKLSRQLFMFQPDQAKYMDYYEQALYNDILSSVAQDNPGNTYHIPLNPGARKSFGNANMSGFTCCNGTALESNTKMQDSIYFRSADNSTLYVNLFVPSTLKWTDKKATVKQETNYPYADSTKITVAGIAGVDVHVRVPDWVTKGFFVKINGVDKKMDAKPGTYISLGKDWKDGDTIELKMPFDFHLSRVMDQQNIASVMWGPIVLAAEENGNLPTWHPMKLDLANLSKSITGDPTKLRFKMGDASLKPFYESYARYSVYFDVKPQ